MKLYDIFEDGLKDLKHNSPLVLAGVACIGVVATSIISIFAGKTLKEKDDVVKKKIEKKKAAGEVVTKKESIVLHVREKWPALAPVVISGAITITCMIFSYKISAKRIVALTTALTVTTQSRDAYKKVAEKLLGEKQLEQEKMKAELEEKPMPKQLEDKVKKEQKSNDINGIYNANQTWWEPNTRQYIYATESNLTKAFEEVNFRVKTGESFVSFDEFLWALESYSEGKVEHPPIATTFGWPNERCSRGITYRLDQGVQAPNGLFVGKIGYRAYTEVTQNDCVSTI